MKSADLIGTIRGGYKAIKHLGMQRGNVYLLVECVYCGKQREMQVGQFQLESTHKCEAYKKAKAKSEAKKPKFENPDKRCVSCYYWRFMSGAQCNACHYYLVHGLGHRRTVNDKGRCECYLNRKKAETNE